MVLSCYNYMRLILDVIIRISVNSGDYNNSTRVLCDGTSALHMTPVVWTDVQTTIYKIYT
jgi:hypothetical protein